MWRHGLFATHAEFTYPPPPLNPVRNLNGPLPSFPLPPKHFSNEHSLKQLNYCMYNFQETKTKIKQLENCGRLVNTLAM